MKEDILEQITEDWLLSQPSTFTKTNVKYKPANEHPEYSSKEDNNYSDIDIMAVHMNKLLHERVSIVSCKSWQGGFSPLGWRDILIDPIKYHKKNGSKEAWKFFRELIIPKWTNAFVQKIKSETGSVDFTYYIAVTNIIEEKNIKAFEDCQLFHDTLKANGAGEVKIVIKKFSEMFTSFFSRNNTQTLEPTIVGRLLQVIKASGLTHEELNKLVNTAEKKGLLNLNEELK